MEVSERICKGIDVRYGWSGDVASSQTSAGNGPVAEIWNRCSWMSRGCAECIRRLTLIGPAPAEIEIE